MDVKTKVAAGFLALLTFFSAPLFSLFMGALIVLYLHRKQRTTNM
ncbi:hypothetical protein [Tetragenococcus koreensis]|uniref:Uncharacterized protein n=1 Tax=Tetragenococcus koreensis TaxID=290335 RepID=A0AAN4RK33_9ENTE|nr:hypothetical protein [Tetragenococcus koreensis]GEN91812.1 hypothetical protein TKO01_18580 [Tetragenococcus koreensis]GEQ48974.1 hypothetical protein TK11N_08260 [Tetragenococcus koreensis]GEQ51409.1 hypothetical protein TK12N_07530 [Tetragenococcus koreensis]GEQ53993.1 hypothetical protein TK2N_08370 [Tetragenococcus koreensis]GEQ56411.1 hypothetical protein TK4N_07540 [Tetragenococcus koreensis]